MPPFGIESFYRASEPRLGVPRLMKFSKASYRGEQAVALINHCERSSFVDHWNRGRHRRHR